MAAFLRHLRVGLPRLLIRPLPLRSSSLQEGGRCAAIHGHSFHQLETGEAESYFEYERDQVHVNSRILEKEVPLCQALSQLASSGILDKESSLWLPRFFASRYVPVIPTGSLKLDAALGIGGLPKGRIVEIFGNEACGKTTIALHIIKEAQNYGGYCAYIDVENGVDPSLVDNIGIDAKKLLFSRPGCAENTLSMVDTLIKSGAINVIVLDSVAALLPQSELDNVIGASSDNMQSQLITRGLRRIHSSLSQSQTILLLVNQVRSCPSSSQNDIQVNEVTYGGSALTFYSAVRLRIARNGLLQTKDEISGINIAVEVIKNKLAPAMKKAELSIRFGRGICGESEVLELASCHNIIQKDGNGYWISNKYLGLAEAEQYLVENHALKNELVTILRTKLFAAM